MTMACQLALNDLDDYSFRSQRGDAGDADFPSPGGGGVCGDGLVHEDERCDDGNVNGGDGCSALCRAEGGWICDGADPTSCDEICGDGRLVGAEAVGGGCDDDNTASQDGCDGSCRAEPGWFCDGEPSACARTCGNGLRDGAEECDDNDDIAGDGCSACVVDFGFACSGQPSVCASTCGDGARANDEGCDDDNVDDGDGCNANCNVENDWTCTESPSTCTRIQSRSCAGLAGTCGPNGTDDCCASTAIPSGTFNRYNDSNFPATVSDFRLDVYEVTVGRFRKFAEAYAAGWRPTQASGKNPNNPEDQGWDGAAWNANLPTDIDALTGTNGLQCDSELQTWSPNASNSTSESRPQNCIDWYISFAFCIWDGGRLPTEAEWNYAATGGGGMSGQRPYPWSTSQSDTTISPTYASYVEGGAVDCLGDGLAGCAVTDLVPVGSKVAGNARWGQADMAGNVREWMVDYYDPSYSNPCTDCAAFSATTQMVLRGGCWYNYPSILLLYQDRTASAPAGVNIYSGARCARNPP